MAGIGGHDWDWWPCQGLWLIRWLWPGLVIVSGIMVTCIGHLDLGSHECGTDFPQLTALPKPKAQSHAIPFVS